MEIQVVPENSKPIALAAVVTATIYGGGTVILPAGVYQPDFKAKEEFRGTEGVFYRAPAKLLFIVPVLLSPNDTRTAAAKNANTLVTGGMFVPNSIKPTGATAIWYEPVSPRAGTAPRVLPLENPVGFQSCK